MKAKNDCKNFVSRIVTTGKTIYELKLRKLTLKNIIVTKTLYVK